MKTSQDPRHQKRIARLQELFSVGFSNRDIPSTVAEIGLALPKIDDKIRIAAPEWPLEQIAKIDLAILRLSIYELLIAQSEPPKVIIDEAIELAKEFGNQNSPQFINGVLGTVYKDSTAT